MDYIKEYEKWLEKIPSDDKEILDELNEIKDNDKEIKERFIKPLEFGTGGLRGIIGAGINRMNTYVVGQATQGLSNVIINLGEDAVKKGVVISYDSRKNSDLFAKESARVLAANGIKAYLFNELHPVPMLSFAIRELKAIAGIMITASHNPAQYNGYKAYWEDGSQLPPEFADKVLKVILESDIFDGVKRADFDEAVKSGMIEIIGEEIDARFSEEVLKLSLNNEVVKQVADDFSIIYTPLHGSGNKPVRRVLKEAGHKNIIVVKEQENPDPMFSTVESPNPENKEGFTIAIEKYAKNSDVDLIIGTDPDCDRVGIVVKDKSGEYITMTGNQVGVLLTNYILTALKEQNKLPEDGAVIKSIVSTKMVEPICEDFGIDMINVLTGFKFIGEKILQFEESKNGTFLFGFEESYGYLSGTHSRDKDGVNASMLIAEMAAYYKTKNMSLYDALKELYEKYGYYNEKVLSVTMPGLDGMERIKQLMVDLRAVPKAFAGVETVAFSDIKESKKICLKTGKEEPIDLPKSDVLRFDLEDDTTIFVRPSGTEPKIKAYIMVKGTSEKDANEKIEKFEKSVLEILK
ncbi:MAG: phospho-sugar mutase [Clostridia bacterium]|nr:phospho-sugar mutase [Clostridia bacterium]